MADPVLRRAQRAGGCGPLNPRRRSPYHRLDAPSAADADEAPKVQQLTFYLVGALGTLLFGFDTGNIAGAILFIKRDFHLGSSEQGFVVSSILIGAVAGAALSGRIADQVGRRRVMLGTAVIFFLGALGCAAAPDAPTLIITRMFLGVGVGASSGTVPVYLAELAPAKFRGRVAGLHQLTIATGILAGYLVDYLLGDAHAWRWMLGIGAAPAVVLFIGMYFLPESPRWLSQHGQGEQARRILRRLRPAASVEPELDQIRRINARGPHRTRDLFAPRMRPVLLTGAAMGILQQVTGINTIIYYAPTILTRVGFGANAALLANVGLGAWTIVMTIIGLWLIDPVGRRRLLVWGAIGMAIAMGILAAVDMGSGLHGGVGGWIVIGCLMLFKASFSLSWGAAFGVIVTEIFPLEFRGTASGVMWSVQWLSNLAVSLSFPTLLDIGSGTVFLIFAGAGVLAVLFAVLAVPETSGRTLEEIEFDTFGTPPAAGDAGGAS